MNYEVSDPNIPPVVQAIARVMGDVREIGKDRRNQQQGFQFRGIDDFYRAYHGPMSKHGVVIVPVRVDDVNVDERTTQKGGIMRFVTMTVTYRIYGPAGDYIEAQVRGEAQDSADKATNKAMSAAQKYLFMQVFVPPVEGVEDADHETHELAPRHAEPPDTGGYSTPAEWADAVKACRRQVETLVFVPPLSDWIKAQGFAWPWRKDTIDAIYAEIARRTPPAGEGGADPTTKARYAPNNEYDQFSEEPF